MNERGRINLPEGFVMKHEQQYIKVNAGVDKGIAKLIEALSGFSFVEIIESCAGSEGDIRSYNPAFVYFVCGDWHRTTDFIFGFLAPKLAELIASEIRFAVATNGIGDPLVKMKMSPEALDATASAVADLSLDLTVQNWSVPAVTPVKADRSCG